MSSEPATPDRRDRTDGGPVVRAVGLGKCYHVYERPQDRLRQFFARAGVRHYREFWALRGVDLAIERGETVGIVGRNGAGKSTLLQLIAGTLKASEGRVEVTGRVTALLELGSGFHMDFSGRDNVFLAGAILGLDREQMTARLERIQSFADIGEFFERPVKTYSQGMFARLAFSVYANLDPEVFIVDEALAVGDARFRHRCMHRFRQMQEQGVSILYVSHDATSMKHLCRRVAWIDGGALRAFGPASDVVDAYLTDLFHGEVKAAAKASPSSAPAVATLADLAGDERTGTGRCRFVDARLCGEDGTPIGHLVPPAVCELHVTLQNEALVPGLDRLQTGFWIANSRGVVVGGTNTGQLGATVPVPEPGAPVRLRYRIELPELVADTYSFTLMASMIDPDGQPVLCDRIVNALVFRAVPTREVAGMVGLPCRVEVLP
jgi:lipopolysaccharide transport system ATP-binding protein